jgi:Saxitoxin biosynthesis operon protein SxtJ
MTPAEQFGYRPLAPPTERSFALVFSAFFSLVAVWPVVHGYGVGAGSFYSGAVAAAFLALGLWRPSLLRLPNLWWFRLAILLNRVMSPLVATLLFFCIFAPFGLILRMAGKDLLRLRWDPGASSYWIARDPPGPPASSMRDQF